MSAVIRLHPNDDVVIARSQLVSGTAIENELITVKGLIPPGHKIATRAIEAGQTVRRYNQVIGFAKQHIEPGQHVAFIGPSGAGKTTIVDMILGLIEPSRGVIKVGSSNYSHTDLIKNNLISYVPQSPGIVSGSIAENVALGIDKDQIDTERVLSALRTAHLADFVNTLPDGIWTSVGSQADALSGGQIQRLGLARALYGKPKLIVLDEATSALDASSEAYISSSLKELGQDVTVIVIAHRLSTVQHSDVVFVVENGSITASGSFMHLRKTVPMVAEYVKLMSFEKTED